MRARRLASLSHRSVDRPHEGTAKRSGLACDAMTRPHAPRTRLQRVAADAVRRARRGLATDLRTGREDAGLSLRRLAAAAGVSASTLRAIEQDDVEPSLQVLARLATVLGMSLSVRLYPGTGPLIRDHIQAAMIEALLEILHERWRPRPEVAVFRPVRGVIDLVLDATTEPLVACEAQSDLRRIEQQVRWSRTKADALQERPRGRVGRQPDGRLTRRPAPAPPLQLRERGLSWRSTAELLRAAYPARARDAYAALTGESPWPGDALLWCRVEDGQATVLDRPPRGSPRTMTLMAHWRRSRTGRSARIRVPGAASSRRTTESTRR